MKTPRLLSIPVVLLIGFALLSTACSGVRQAAQRQQRSNDLKQIALAYTNYCDANQKGPANANDLLTYVENDALLVQKMQSDYTFIWGVNLRDMRLFAENGTSNTVLGYETTVPTSGGLVVMCDGFVTTMTASEFNAAPKAKSGDGKANK
jgi:hypothetical protein